MEVATAKPVYTHSGPSQTPSPSNRNQQQQQDEEGSVAFEDAESIPGENGPLDDVVAGSIPIRAPVSVELEDVDNESFGTQEEEEGDDEEDDEEDFESASERTAAASDGASPVGSVVAGNPTFLYTQSAAGRPKEFRYRDPVDEPFLEEAVHKGLSSDDDDEVSALVRVREPLVGDIADDSSYSTVLPRPAMPLAKLSGDDDDGDRTQTDEEVEEEEEEEVGGYDGDFGVAKVSPYSVSGGIRVSVSETDRNVDGGDAGGLQEIEPNDGQPGILGESTDKFDTSKVYRIAEPETPCPGLERLSSVAREARRESSGEQMEESGVNSVAEDQSSTPAKVGGAPEDFEPQGQEIADGGASVVSDSNPDGMSEDEADGDREFEGAEAGGLGAAKQSVLEKSDVKREEEGIIDERGIAKEGCDALELGADVAGEEFGVLARAEEGVLGNSDVNQEEGTGVEDIVNCGESVDAPVSVDYDSKGGETVGQECADIGRDGDGDGEITSKGSESKRERIENAESEFTRDSIEMEDAVDNENAVKDGFLLNFDSKKDDVVEQERIDCGKEREEGRKSEADDVRETGEAGVLVTAKEGVSENSNVKEETLDKCGIVDNEKVADGDGSLNSESMRDAIRRQETVNSGEEADDTREYKAKDKEEDEALEMASEGVLDGFEEKEEEFVKGNVAFTQEVKEGPLGDSQSREDGIGKEDEVVTGKRIDDSQEYKVNDTQGTKEAKFLATAVGGGSEGSYSGLEGIAEEVIVDPVKIVEDADKGVSPDTYSKQDGVAKQVVVGTRKEADDKRDSESNDGWKINEAEVVGTDNEVVSENKQDTFDTTSRAVYDGSSPGSDSKLDETVEDEVILSGEEARDTRKAGLDGMQETKGGENEELKLLNFADATAKEEVKSDLDHQKFQNVGELKDGIDVSRREVPGSLKPKEDKESKWTMGDSNAGGKVQDDTLQAEASPDASAILDNVGRNLDPRIEFAVSGNRDTAGKVTLDEVLLASDNRVQLKFDSSSVNDEYIQKVDGRLVVNWDEEADDEEDGEDEEMVESSALAALMEAARSAGTGSSNASFGAAGFTVSTPPSGLGSSVPSLEPASRSVQNFRSNGSASSRPSALVEDNRHNGDSDDGYDETQEKLQRIRVKFLRLVQKLGQSPQNVVVTQVLYRLGLAEGLRRGRTANRAFSFDRANAIAEQQEAAGLDLDFICNIMVLGKTGVGKSATINSIFDEVKSATDAFQPATNKVQEILGTVCGIKVRVIDTPGLMPCFADQRRNKKNMSLVKKSIGKCPPDIVLYVDRLDVQSRDYSDIPLLKNITDTFGAAIWFNAIVVLTHASSAPPDGANGTPLSYEMFVAQRSHVVQHSIRQAAGDMRLMNPVSLVENHSACRTNRAGQRVLPNGQIWKPQLLLLCFASKVLAEANSLLKLEDSTPGRPFGVRTRGPPLPFLLSSLLQSRAQLKIPDEQGGEEVESDEDFEELSDSEDEDEYDRLPAFKHLRKSQLSKLSKEQRKAYFDEVDYREKLFQKKQWKEELRRRRNMKKMPEAYKDESQPMDENFDEEGARAAPVAVPMPDMAIPMTFDSDNPTYRYRYLDTTSQWLVRPVLETHGWDHDTGYEGINVEKMLVVGNKIPASISGQITKDKKEANLQLECAASLKHGERKVTLAGFDVQTVGKDLAYTLRSETRFSNFNSNKTTGGLALTLSGDTLATGVKLEDRLMIGKRLKLVVNGGAMMGRGNMAYGGSLEATLRHKDYTIGQTLATLGLSVMQWHGDLAIGGNLQSQIAVGRKTNIVTRANLNNKGSGQITIRTSSSEQLQIALIGIIPIIRTLVGGRLLGDSQSTR